LRKLGAVTLRHAVQPHLRQLGDLPGELGERFDLEIGERALRARVALDHLRREVPRAIGDPAVALRPGDERGAQVVERKGLLNHFELWQRRRAKAAG